MPGIGTLVRMDKIKADAAPAAVNIGNWREGGDAFAQAFGPVIVKMFEAMQAQAQAPAPALPAPATPAPAPKGKEIRDATLFPNCLPSLIAQPSAGNRVASLIS